MPTIPFLTESDTKVDIKNEQGETLLSIELIDLELKLEASLTAAKNSKFPWHHHFAKELSLLFQREVGASQAMLIGNRVSKEFHALKKNYETLSSSLDSMDSTPAPSPDSNSDSTFVTSLDSPPSVNSNNDEPDVPLHLNDSAISS